MHDHLQVLTAIGLGLGIMLASTQVSVARQNPVTAIDIALEPDADDGSARDGRQRSSAQGFPEGLCSG